MAVSLRFHAKLPYMQRLLKEADIANCATQVVAVHGHHGETEPMSPLAFYLIEEPYPLMKVVKGIAKWMRNHDMPPSFIGLSFDVLDEYWGKAVNWQELHLSTYYYHLPDGSLFPVELYMRVNQPDCVVCCGEEKV